MCSLISPVCIELMEFSVDKFRVVRGVPIAFIRTIKDMYDGVKSRVSLGTGKETEESNLLQQLSDACLVVDALEPSVREELVKIFCNRELTSYQQIFEGAAPEESLITSMNLSSSGVYHIERDSSVGIPPSILYLKSSHGPGNFSQIALPLLYLSMGFSMVSS
ncbi:Vacuolar protein sorting-associated protein 53 [Datura stramonium]|uniref:Vacuolar protein sorting-associated protein 53 n=1 Tax=Datura stramonium TaxID=4076 RepID=A0ABS8VK09_DATST|nr:Vacuolar protein sorting-associated protein 53 [Datura stramonium]